MAKDKKTKVESGELKFDSELDFNFDDGFDIIDPSRRKKKRSPIQDVVRGTVDAAKAKLKTGAFWNSIAKKALPPSYTVITNEFGESKRVLSETYRESVRLLKPDLTRIGRQVDSLVPGEAKRIKKYTSKLRGYESTGSQSAESLQTQAIIQAQAEVFDKLRMSGDSKEARDRAEERIKDKIESKRFTTSANILGNINEGIQRIASYTTSVNSSWQKKSLELQYRSYFVQAELLKSTNRYNELFKAYFEAIKENTALPDFVKITKTERFKEMAQNKLFAGVQQGLAAGIKRASKRATEYVRSISDALGTAAMGLDQAQDMKEQLLSAKSMAKEMGMDESAFYGGSNILASIALEFFGDEITNKIGGKLKKHFPEGGKVSKGLARSARFFHDPTEEVDKLQKNAKFKELMDREGFVGGFFRLLNDFAGDLKTPEQSKTLTTGPISAAKLEPHFFSNRAHKSITEIIPGYLARILQEQVALRTKSKKLGGLLMYDWRSSKFITSKQFAQKTQDELIKTAKSGSSDWKLDQISQAFTGTELQGDQAVRVKKFIHSAISDQKLDLTSDKIFETEEFKKLKPEDQKLLKEGLGKLQSKEEGKLIISGSVKRVREDRGDQIASAQKLLHDLIQGGHGEQLIEEGYIIETPSGGYEFNTKKYQTLLQEHGITAKGTRKPIIKGLFVPRKNEEGKHIYEGEREGWKWDETSKTYTRLKRGEKHPHDPDHVPSDRNIKKNISKKRKDKILDKVSNLGTYQYSYRPEKDDGHKHQGYMAQEVYKAFGKEFAPGGVKVDMSAMTSMNTEAIKQLHQQQQEQMKDSETIRILKSIDKRLAEMTTLGKLQIGIDPTEDSKKFFGDMFRSAAIYAERMKRKGKKLRKGKKKGTSSEGTDQEASDEEQSLIGDVVSFAGRMIQKLGPKVGRLSRTVTTTAKGVGTVAGSLAKGAGGFAKDAIERNKDKASSAAHRLIEDVLALTGRTYDFGKNLATNIIPGAFKTLKNIADTALGKVKGFLSKPRDFYLPGLKEPILIGDFFSKGYYFDSQGNPILDLDALKKVKDGVYKKTGEVVVTASQMAEGLFDRQGNKLDSLISNVKDLAWGAAGWVGSNVIKGLGRMKDALGAGLEFGGKAGATLGSGLQAMLGRLAPGHKTNKTLGEILDLLKKWDKKGFAGGSSSSDTPNPTMAGTADTAATASAGVEPGVAGEGFKAMGATVKGVKSAAKILTGDKAKALYSKIGNLKGMQRLGNLGGGKLGRFAAKAGGLAGSLGGLLGGKPTDSQPQADGAQQDTNQQPQPGSQKQPATPGFFDRLLKKFNKVPAGQRAWNDTEGTGRRTGDFRTRLENQKEKDEARKVQQAANQQANQGDTDAAQTGGVGGLLSGLMDTFTNLRGGLSSVLDIATGSLGGLIPGMGGKKGKGSRLKRGMKGFGGKVLGAAGAGLGVGGKILGAPFRAAGGLLRGAAGVSRWAGNPFVKGVAKIGGTGIGRFIAANAARTAAIAGASSVFTGGLGLGVSAAITGLGAVLTSPVLLGALAIGGTAYAGVKLYKYLSRDKLDDFQKIRFLQYGFGTEITEKYNHVVANLENYLLAGRVGYETVPGTTDGKRARLIKDKINPEEIFKIFEIDPSDEDAGYKFVEWFEARFKPFFLNAITALYSVNPKTSLNDISSLKAEEKVKFLKAAQFKNGPYDYSDSPIKEIDRLESNRDAVEKAISSLVAKTEKSDQRTKKRQEITRNAINSVLEFTGLKKTDVEIEADKRVEAAKKKIAERHKAQHEAKMDKIKQASLEREGIKTNAATATVSPDHESDKLGQGSGGRPAEPSAKTTTIVGSAPPLASGTISEGSGAMKFIKLKDKSVDINGLNPSVLKNFLGMVQEYGETTGKSIQVNSAYRSLQQQAAEYNANPGKAARPGRSLHNFGLAIDVNSSDLDALEKLGLMRKYGFTRPVGGETWHTEPAGIQTNLDLAKSNPAMASQMTEASLLKGGGGPGSIRGTKLGGRNKEMQLALLNAPSKAPDQKQAANASGTTNGQISGKLDLATTLVPSSPAANDSKTLAPSTASAKASMTAMSQNKPFSYTQNDKYGIDISPPTPSVSPETLDGEVGTLADKASGDAGASTDFPMDREGILKAIDTYAKKVGVPGKDLQVFAAMESSLNPQAKIGTTGASGLFQFTKGTWAESMNKYGRKHGLEGNETPFNVKASTLLAGEYMKANLQRVKEVSPNPGLVEAYLTHFLGAGGARTFLRANPDAIAAHVFPKEASKNRPTFFDGNRPRTIREMYTFIADKLKKVASSFGISGVSVGKGPPSKTTGTESPMSNAEMQNNQPAMQQTVMKSDAPAPSISTAVAKATPATPTSGDYQYTSGQAVATIPQTPREIAAPAPSFVSNRTADTRAETGDSPMKDLVKVANNSVNIQQKSLDTMIEIRDLIKSFVSARGNSTQHPTMQGSKPNSSTRDVISPMVNIGRVRNASA